MRMLSKRVKIIFRLEHLAQVEEKLRDFFRAVQHADLVHLSEMEERFTKRATDRHNLRLIEKETDRKDLSGRKTARRSFASAMIPDELAHCGHPLIRADDVGKFRTRIEKLLLTRLVRYVKWEGDVTKSQREAEVEAGNLQRRLDVVGGTPLYRLICALAGEEGSALEGFAIFDQAKGGHNEKYLDRQRWIRKLHALEIALHSIEREFDWEVHGHMMLTARRPYWVISGDADPSTPEMLLTAVHFAAMKSDPRGSVMQRLLRLSIPESHTWIRTPYIWEISIRYIGRYSGSSGPSRQFFLNAVDLAALYNRALSLRSILHSIEDITHVQMALRVWGRRDSRYGVIPPKADANEKDWVNTAPHDRWQPEESSEFAKTPLQIACEANNTDVVRVLLYETRTGKGNHKSKTSSRVQTISRSIKRVFKGKTYHEFYVEEAADLAVRQLITHGWRYVPKKNGRTTSTVVLPLKLNESALRPSVLLAVAAPSPKRPMALSKQLKAGQFQYKRPVYFAGSRDECDTDEDSKRWTEFLGWLKDFKGGHAPPAKEVTGDITAHLTRDRWLQAPLDLALHWGNLDVANVLLQKMQAEHEVLKGRLHGWGQPTRIKYTLNHQGMLRRRDQGGRTNREIWNEITAGFLASYTPAWQEDQATTSWQRFFRVGGTKSRFHHDNHMQLRENRIELEEEFEKFAADEMTHHNSQKQRVLFEGRLRGHELKRRDDRYLYAAVAFHLLDDILLPDLLLPTFQPSWSDLQEAREEAAGLRWKLRETQPRERRQSVALSAIDPLPRSEVPEHSTWGGDKFFASRFTQRQRFQLASSILGRGETVVFTDDVTGRLVLDLKSSMMPGVRARKSNEKGRLSKQIERELKQWETAVRNEIKRVEAKRRKLVKDWEKQYANAALADNQTTRP